MLTLKDRIKVGLAQYVIHLHFVSCSKYFFLKKVPETATERDAAKGIRYLPHKKLVMLSATFREI